MRGRKRESVWRRGGKTTAAAGFWADSKGEERRGYYSWRIKRERERGCCQMKLSLHFPPIYTPFPSIISWQVPLPNPISQLLYLTPIGKVSSLPPSWGTSTHKYGGGMVAKSTCMCVYFFSYTYIYIHTNIYSIMYSILHEYLLLHHLPKAFKC